MTVGFGRCRRAPPIQTASAAAASTAAPVVNQMDRTEAGGSPIPVNRCQRARSSRASAGTGGGRTAREPPSEVVVTEGSASAGVRGESSGAEGVRAATGRSESGVTGGGAENAPAAPLSCWRTSLSDPSSSSIDWNRSARSFAMHRSTMASSCASMARSGRSCLGGTGASCRCFKMMSTGLTAVNGTLPVSIW